MSDRFSPSTLAYQGVARGLGVEVVAAISEFAAGGIEPDLVVVLDVPDAVADDRKRGEPDRLESAGTDFHARVRQAYRDLAESQGWLVLDGSGAADDVEAAVWAGVSQRLG